MFGSMTLWVNSVFTSTLSWSELCLLARHGVLKTWKYGQALSQSSSIFLVCFSAESGQAINKLFAVHDLLSNVLAEKASTGGECTTALIKRGADCSSGRSRQIHNTACPCIRYNLYLFSFSQMQLIGKFEKALQQDHFHNGEVDAVKPVTWDVGHRMSAFESKVWAGWEWPMLKGSPIEVLKTCLEHVQDFNSLYAIFFENSPRLSSPEPLICEQLRATVLVFNFSSFWLFVFSKAGSTWCGQILSAPGSLLVAVSCSVLESNYEVSKAKIG